MPLAWRFISDSVGTTSSTFRTWPMRMQAMATSCNSLRFGLHGAICPSTAATCMVEMCSPNSSPASHISHEHPDIPATLLRVVRPVDILAFTHQLMHIFTSDPRHAVHIGHVKQGRWFDSSGGCCDGTGMNLRRRLEGFEVAFVVMYMLSVLFVFSFLLLLSPTAKSSTSIAAPSSYPTILADLLRVVMPCVPSNVFGQGRRSHGENGENFRTFKPAAFPRQLPTTRNTIMGSRETRESFNHVSHYISTVIYCTSLLYHCTTVPVHLYCTVQYRCIAVYTVIYCQTVRSLRSNSIWYCTRTYSTVQ